MDTSRTSRWCALVLAVALAPGCTTTADPHFRSSALPATVPSVQVVLLGTGTPNAEPDRSGPALAIVVGEQSYLVDAGPGVVRRANAAAEQGIAALRPAQLRRVFITHLHSDHTLGLADLIFTPWVLGRDVPLEVWGPPGLTAMCEHLAAAYDDDVKVRLHGLEPANPHGWRVEPHEVAPGEVYRDEAVAIEAFLVTHGSATHAYGYRVTTDQGVIVISGDTGPSGEVEAAAHDADLLVHEAYATAGWQRREPVWQSYHASFHTSGHQVGELASRAGVGTVVLTHQLLWGATEEELVEEVRDSFDGPVHYGRDLDVFDLARGKVTKTATNE